jgi:hypothetical protein
MLFPLRVAKVLQRRFSEKHKCPKALCFQGVSGICKPICIIPTRKTNLNLKQICFSGLAQFDSVCVRLPKSHQLS